MSFSAAHLSGYVTFSRKKSGEKFTREDVFLLRTLSERLALNLERILLQEEVVYERAAREKLDEVNRLKTEFISAVSHELRTPLSTLQGLSELLHAGKVKDKQKQARMLGMMSDECTRLSHFLHNILDMGKIEQGSMTYRFVETDLGAIVQDTLALFEHRLKSEGFEVQLQLPQEPVLLSLDAGALKRALTNLIDNALKYSTRTKRLEVELTTISSRTTLSIRDFGMGIPEKELPHIFSSFFRGQDALHEHPAGAGMGLKIVKHILDAHTAEIAVDTRRGEGSTFTLTFEGAT
jgi:two-component system phosphate regulon sensor histidine kinase PhoR